MWPTSFFSAHCGLLFHSCKHEVHFSLTLGFCESHQLIMFKHQKNTSQEHAMSTIIVHLFLNTAEPKTGWS